jgi:hypothetical protein
MRTIIRFGWAAAVGLAVGGAANAQTGGGTGTTGGGTTGGTGGLTGGTGLGGTGTVIGSTLSTIPTISGMDTSSGTTTNTRGALNQSNIFSPYYANPYYQGRAGAAANTAPGGFGQVLYSTSGSPSGYPGGTGTTGTSGFGTTGGRTSTTGFGGTSSGFGGSTGFGGTGSGFGGTSSGFGTGGFGTTGGIGGGLGRTGVGGVGGIGGVSVGGLGGVGTSNQGGIQVIPNPYPIAYTATLRFTPPAVAPRQMQADLQTMISRSPAVSNARGVQVLTDGRAVVLRGSARDEDEARLIEGMVRLTPGVRDVRNELNYPGRPQPATASTAPGTPPPQPPQP